MILGKKEKLFHCLITKLDKKILPKYLILNYSRWIEKIHDCQIDKVDVKSDHYPPIILQDNN